MKVDEVVRSELVYNLRTIAKNIIDELFLAEYIDILVSGPTCYFCIQSSLLHDDDEDVSACTKCPYSKYHGICSKVGSDWRKIMSTLYKEQIYNIKEIQRNLEKLSDEIGSILTEYTDKIEKAETVEEIMKLKQEMLVKVFTLVGMPKTAKIISEIYYEGEKYDSK